MTPPMKPRLPTSVPFHCVCSLVAKEDGAKGSEQGQEDDSMVDNLLGRDGFIGVQRGLE